MARVARRKPRPVLVLTRDDVIGRALDVVAMPASRTAHDWLTEVELGPDDEMPTTCFLIAENTLSAETISLTQRITELSAAKMDATCRARASATSCG